MSHRHRHQRRLRRMTALYKAIAALDRRVHVLVQHPTGGVSVLPEYVPNPVISRVIGRMATRQELDDILGKDHYL